MQVVSGSPFRVATLLWQPRTGEFATTVLCKATYAMSPGRAALAEIQDALLKDDVHHGHDPGRSLRAASDLAPPKPRADVVVVGHAYAEGRTPVRSLLARVVVGEVDKTVALSAPRYFDVYGNLHEGAPAAQFPLAYERAAAGADNPAGLRMSVRDASGNIDVPNLLPEGFIVRAPTDNVPPIGLGPIAATWPRRMEKLGGRGASWSFDRWYRQPLDGLDLAFFQAAPADQQTSLIRPDERIVLENLHPDLPILVTCLPGVFPTAVVELPNLPPIPLTFRGDTLCIDTDRQLCTLVFRAQFNVPDPRVDGRITVTMETLQSGLSAGQGMQETVGPLDAPPVRAMPLPVSMPGAHASQSGSTTATPFSTFGAPVAFGASAPNPVSTSGAPVAGSQGPMSLQGFAMRPSGAYPPYVPPTPSQSQAPTPPTTPPPPPVAVTPPKTTPPPPPVAVTPPKTTPPPPPVVVAPPADPPPIPQTIGQSMVSQAAHDTSRPPGPGPNRPPDLLAPVDEEQAQKQAQDKLYSDITARGVLAASDAAQDRAAKSESTNRGARKRPFATPAELLRLVWLDADLMTKVRRNPEFQPILEALDKKPVDREADHAAPDMTPAEIEDRREATEILLAAVPLPEEGIRQAMSDGIREDGRYAPAPVALRGELEIAFDAIDMLRALVPIAAAYAGGAADSLSQAVAGASAFLGSPGHPSPIVAETLAERIRAAFGKTQKKSADEALDGPAERLLLEQRRFRRCAVFGDTYLRAGLRIFGAKEEIPVYLPESAAKKLPLSRSFVCRLLGEVHLPADPHEAYPAAIRAAALAEVLVPASGRPA